MAFTIIAGLTGLLSIILNVTASAVVPNILLGIGVIFGIGGGIAGSLYDLSSLGIWNYV